MKIKRILNRCRQYFEGGGVLSVVVRIFTVIGVVVTMHALFVYLASKGVTQTKSLIVPEAIAEEKR